MVHSAEKSELFVSVIEAHKGILFKITNSYCKNAEDRKDLLQEIIIQLWKSFDRYDSHFKFSTWIYRIALNVSITYFRKANRRRQVYGAITDDILWMSEENTSNTLEAKINYLHHSISELKPLDKALMILYLEENSYKDIALIMGISETNVGTKINRIKAVLKEKFSTIKTL